MMWDYETRYSGDFDPVVAVVESLATVEDVDPLEIEPLYNQFVVQALNRLILDSKGSPERTLSDKFSNEDYTILVQVDGVVRVAVT